MIAAYSVIAFYVLPLLPRLAPVPMLLAALL